MIAIFWCPVSGRREEQRNNEQRLTGATDIWFHRYKDGHDIEGRFDYNSWQESDTGRKLAATLDKNVVLAEGMTSRKPGFGRCKMLTIITGYKEYQTDRKYMARMGDWRDNKDVEIPLDGIGGVNIIVKADVHRAGELQLDPRAAICAC